MTKLGMDFPTKWARGYSARSLRQVIQGGFMVPYA